MGARRRLGLARVRGRSMEPTYRAGDRLIVLHGARPRPGRAHLVDLPPGRSGPRPLALKRLVGRAGTGWWVLSDAADEPGVVDSRTVGALPDEAIRAVVLVRAPRRPRQPHLRILRR